MNETLIRCEHVSLFLPGDVRHEFVLDDITLEVTRGEHAAITGVNGSGKSTLLKLLAGELWVSKGRIAWRDPEGFFDTSPLTGRAITALVSPAQQFRFERHAFSITGLELVLTGFDGSDLLYRTGTREQEARSRALSRSLDCEDLLFRDISQLSQGQLRILLICRALIKEPSVLLLDECCDGLDAEHLKRMSALLQEVARTTTVIFVTHDESLIPDFCRVRKNVVRGRLCDRLCNRLDDRLYDGKERGLIPVPDALPFDVPAKRDRREGEETPPLFALKNATVFVEGTEVLHQINWTVLPGEHWLVLGANGSGKSTLLRLLNGDEQCAAGGSIRRWLPSAAEGQGGFVSCLLEMRKGISLVSAKSEVNYDYPLSALDLVASGFENTVGIYREYSCEELDVAERLLRYFFRDLSAVDCAKLCTLPVSRLSTGQMRRLFLARALVSRPDVLLLDEPMSGLDVFARARFLALLNQLALGVLDLPPITLIFVSHKAQEIPPCLNRCCELREGHLRVLKSGESTLGA